MRRRIPVLIVLISLAWLAGLACGEKPVAETTAPEQLLVELSSAAPPFVLDVRTPGEFAQGHVPGAVNIPHDALPARLTELEPERQREIVVYCERGGRAAVAEKVLREAGFGDVVHLEGDMAAWRAAGRPVEKSTP